MRGGNAEERNDVESEQHAIMLRGVSFFSPVPPNFSCSHCDMDGKWVAAVLVCTVAFWVSERLEINYGGGRIEKEKLQNTTLLVSQARPGCTYPVCLYLFFA